MASKTSRQTEDADGTLRVGPYYNKLTQEGFYQYFKAVAEEVDLPIVLYNIPVPTVNSIRAQKSKTGIAFWAGTPPKQIRPSWFLEKASN